MLVYDDEELLVHTNLYDAITINDKKTPRKLANILGQDLVR